MVIIGSVPRLVCETGMLGLVKGLTQPSVSNAGAAY
jgi:hypothetical protein